MDIVERGSFWLAHCLHCGWWGAARRARASSQREADAHAPACPGSTAED
ncbi:MAG: hypothetical protein Q4G67_05915 [Actinomycetia bacterium]|nr:hypothetical protein [Actinomycetes bacterium]